MIKKMILLCLGLLYLNVFTSYAQTDINWLDNIDEGLKQAAAQNKLLLVDFSASWCGWCTKLKEEVFEKQEFKNAVSDTFILVVVDTDANRELLEKYKIQGLPTIVIFDKEGKEIHRIIGFRKLDEFIKELELVKSNY